MLSHGTCFWKKKTYLSLDTKTTATYEIQVYVFFPRLMLSKNLSYTKQFRQGSIISGYWGDVQLLNIASHLNVKQKHKDDLIREPALTKAISSIIVKCNWQLLIKVLSIFISKDALGWLIHRGIRSLGHFPVSRKLLWMGVMQWNNGRESQMRDSK